MCSSSSPPPALGRPAGLTRSCEQRMGREVLTGADLELTEVERAQLDPLAGSIQREQRNALELFCHANAWNVTVDVHLSPAVASLPTELHFPQQEMPSNSLTQAALKWRSLCKAGAALQVAGA